jgi:hypothetical protein
MTFLASHPGTCIACGERFGAGAEIEFAGSVTVSSGSLLGAYPTYTHAVCPPSVLDQQRPACPSCFLELPVSGVCGECS